MKKAFFLILLLCLCLPFSASATPAASLQNIIIEQRENRPVMYFEALAAEANPHMPNEMRQSLTDHAGEYTEAWLQITFPKPSGDAENLWYEVRFPSFSEDVILLSNELVNGVDEESTGIITDSIRLAVKRDVSAEEVCEILREIGPYIEISDSFRNAPTLLPITMDAFDPSFTAEAAQGFCIHISYGRIRSEKPSPVLFSVLPKDVYADYCQNPQNYCVIDLFGAKIKHTENPVLGVEFKVEGRDDLWAVPTNEDIYFSSVLTPAPHCDNLLWSGPEFVSITLLYKKPQDVLYSYQIYENIRDMKISVYFSPAGYGSLEEIRGDTIYSPTICTTVDFSHFRPWMFK